MDPARSVEVEVMDDIAVFIDSLAMRVVAPTIVREPASVCKKPEELKFESMVWFRVKAAAATATHASSMQIEIDMTPCCLGHFR